MRTLQPDVATFSALLKRADALKQEFLALKADIERFPELRALLESAAELNDAPPDVYALHNALVRWGEIA